MYRIVRLGTRTRFRQNGITRWSRFRPLNDQAGSAKPNNEKVPSPPKSPLLPPSKDTDRFVEMMEDRTRALLKSLGLKESSILSSGNYPHDANPEQFELRKYLSDDASSIPPHVSAAHYGLGASLRGVCLFDTQKVYDALVEAGCTRGQAEVIMSAIKCMTEDIVERSYHSSVPDSAGANEAYLFDAASSEVKSEVQTSRLAQANQYRFNLARLQRDVEILDHEATEMGSSLKSDLDIELHERQNASRAEAGNVHLKIQELQNKIGTRLNSELKSEIEKLRWQITRRSIAAVVVASAAILYVTQLLKFETKRQPTTKESYGAEVRVPVLSPSVDISDEYDEHPGTVVDELGEAIPIIDPHAPATADASASDFDTQVASSQKGSS